MMVFRRITSARRDEALRTYSSSTSPTDHPRARGRDVAAVHVANYLTGSPPRAGTRRPSQDETDRAHRITPARGDETHQLPTPLAPCWDHPRVLGRELHDIVQDRVQVRSTPACEDENRSSPGYAGRRQDHPRTRGRDAGAFNKQVFSTGSPRTRGRDDAGYQLWNGKYGSPPHAGTRPTSFAPMVLIARITPARGDETSPTMSAWRRCPDHPRTRGRDNGITFDADAYDGSPPHAGTRHRFQDQVLGCDRITPARGDETRADGGLHRLQPDHPRTRGRDSCSQVLDFTQYLLPGSWHRMVIDYAGWSLSIPHP